MGALQIAPEIAQALGEGTPIVALESALITHGFAPPANLDIAQQMEAAIRAKGALPATIAILDGQARIGLSEEELTRLSADRSARKVSLRSARRSLRSLLTAMDGFTAAAPMNGNILRNLLIDKSVV